MSRVQTISQRRCRPPFQISSQSCITLTVTCLPFCSKFWTRNRPGDILRDVLGGDGQTGNLPNLKADELGVGGSVNEDSLVEEAVKLPIFDVTTNISANAADEQALVENVEEPLVEIPGLNDGHPGPLYASGEDSHGDGEEEDDGDKDKNRSLPPRPGGSISKEFMANWSSSRVAPKPSVVLSAVAAATAQKDGANRDSGEFGTGEIPQEDLGVDEDDPAFLRNVSTPLVTSDMCMNPKAKAAANEAAEYDARHKSGRKFDTAAREEEMLAFANSLMPSSPPPPEPPALQQPRVPPQQQKRSQSPKSEASQPPRPPPNQPMPPPPQRFGAPPMCYVGMRYPSGGGGPGGPHPPPYPPYWGQPPPPHVGGRFGGPPSHDQWGPSPQQLLHYNGPMPPPHGYGPGGPPSKRPAMHPPPPPHQHGRQTGRRNGGGW